MTSFTFSAVSVLCCVTLLGLVTGNQAFASPVTANVIGSNIKSEAVGGVEYRNGYEFDDNNPNNDQTYTDRIDLFYNMTNDSQFRVFLNRVNPDGENSDFSNIFIEPAFQLFNVAENGFDGVVTTGLTLASGSNRPNQIRSILSGTIPIHNGFFRHNSVIAHQFGAEAVSGLRYEARWRVMQNIAAFGDSTQIGLEMFNNFLNLRTDSSFNDMVHRAGPVMTGKLTDEVSFQTGILRGISDNSPDWAGKFWLSYQFDTSL